MEPLLKQQDSGQAPVVRVALAGNPNSGKSSLFNALTGAHQHVGNYPGVTVEKRSGSYRFAGHRVEVADLPGTYSLSALSPEERIARDELLGGGHDVVVTVVDATALERSLVLLVQLQLMGAHPVLCLNMSDEARAAGQRLDLEALRARLGCPVVETVGHRRVGIDGLRQAIAVAACAPERGRGWRLDGELGAALVAICQRMNGSTPADGSGPWLAARLLLEDRDAIARVRAQPDDGEAVLAEANAQRRRLVARSGVDATLAVMQGYRGAVQRLLDGVLLAPARANARALSDRIDRVLAHRWLGLPVFFAVMYALFWITFTVGELPMGWIEGGFAALAAGIDGLWDPGQDSALRSLLVDGVIGGVGGVLVFLPNIVLLFLGLVALEDTGYMARAAFLMDRGMHRFGLHGRSFVSMMTGFGCSVPGILATRTLDDERDRLTTMLVLPLMSCGARLPIWMLLVPAFFAPAWRAPALWGIYATGIALALGLAWLLRRTLLRGDDAPFVMELPPYRLPTLRAVVARMVERSLAYLRKAGTVILSISIMMWAITTYPKKPHFDVDAAVASGDIHVIAPTLDEGLAEEARARVLADARAAAVVDSNAREVLTADEVAARRLGEDLRHSIAGRVGRALEPLLAPLGFDWKIGTALVGAFAAKEVFVAQMGIVYALGEADAGSSALRATLARDYSPLVGVSLMLFLLVATPCMATVAVTRRESGRWAWALGQFAGLTAVAYLLSLLVFQLGRLLG